MSTSTQVSTPIPRQTVGRTFIVAISLMGLVVLGQIGVAGYAYYQKTRVPLHPVVVKIEPDVATPSLAPTPVEPETSAPTEIFPGLSAMPTPIPAVRSSVAIETRVAALIEQARMFRQRGDTNSALIKLREAQTLENDLPLVIAEMALTYEMMSLTDKALEQWQRLSSLGEAGGALTHLARMKLDPAFASRRLDEPEMPASTAQIQDMQGIQPGSTLGLMEIQTVVGEDEDAEEKVDLKVGLRARPDVEIDVRDVAIQVLFFDMLEGEHIVQTNASVNSRWSTSPPDWKEDGIEVLEVGYLQPKVPLAELSAEEASRKYYGYIVRLYYKNELEDVRAEPVSLLSLFPSTPEMEHP